MPKEPKSTLLVTCLVIVNVILVSLVIAYQNGWLPARAAPAPEATIPATGPPQSIENQPAPDSALAPAVNRSATLPADLPLTPIQHSSATPAAPPPSTAPTPETTAAGAYPNLYTSSPSRAEIAADLAQAGRLEAAGQFTQSLAILDKLDRTVPAGARPPELDQALARVRKHVSHKMFGGDN